MLYIIKQKAASSEPKHTEGMLDVSAPAFLSQFLKKNWPS